MFRASGGPSGALRHLPVNGQGAPRHDRIMREIELQLD
jgi:hypothetical protein